MRYIILIQPLLFLSGCTNGDFDTVAFVKNPVIVVIIGIVTLYLAFKMRKK